jgi:hypothetical protein
MESDEGGCHILRTPRPEITIASQADIQGRLAPATFVVDNDNNAISDNSLDYTSIDSCSRQLQDYLADRFSCSGSFEDCLHHI